MKKHYVPATADVIKWSLSDILTASGGGEIPDITDPPVITGVPNAPDDPDLLEPMYITK